MKKHIIILFLVSIQIQFYGQIRTIPVKCNDSVLMSIIGRWKKAPDNISPPPNFSRAQVQEALNRMDAMHQLLMEAYPKPTGNDGTWWRNLSLNMFAADDRAVHFIPLCRYSYYCAFGYYSCLAYHPNQVASGGETGTWLRVYVNDFEKWKERILVDTMTVNGLPVYWRNPVKAVWKGYDMVHCGASSRAVLISRKRELPFMPVTRKQYLDYCIRYLNQLYDQIIQSSKDRPVRTLAEQEEEKKKALDQIDQDYKNNPKNREDVRNIYLGNFETDQQRRDKDVTTQMKLKADIINRYQKELGKTTTAHLLNVPAIILQMHPVAEEASIFATEEEDGKMLVTDNPSYIKRDLPKYTPQFIVLYWSWNEGAAEGFAGGAQGAYYRKMVEANFPIQKLQAMIDK